MAEEARATEMKLRADLLRSCIVSMWKSRRGVGFMMFLTIAYEKFEDGISPWTAARLQYWWVQAWLRGATGKTSVPGVDTLRIDGRNARSGFVLQTRSRSGCMLTSRLRTADVRRSSLAPPRRRSSTRRKGDGAFWHRATACGTAGACIGDRADAPEPSPCP